MTGSGVKEALHQCQGTVTFKLSNSVRVALDNGHQVLAPRNYPQRSHQNDICDRKHSQEQQRPFRTTFLEGNPAEVRRHGHCHQKRKTQTAHQNRIAFRAEHRERHRSASDRADAVSCAVKRNGKRNDWEPERQHQGRHATSVADATIVHTGS